jgi:hypothetical protein
VATRPPILAVPKNLYKHFAVVTVAVTLCVAMFADGAKREQIAEQVAAHQRAKAQERHKAAEERRIVAGLRDNRGGRSYVINNNPDVGSVPSGPIHTIAYPIGGVDEFGEPGLRPGALDQPLQAIEPKLPPVLPPGMSPIPGVRESTEASMEAG